MKKTIKISEEHSIVLSNNIGWAFEYRDQFGHDIIPVLMPALSGALNAFLSLGKHMDEAKTVKQIVEGLDPAEFTDAMIELSGLRFTDFLNIIWAMAKCADDDVPEPRIWFRQFDEFPLDVIGPQAMELILKGVVSSKNLERLQKTIGRMKANTSALMTSSSPDRKED